MSTNNVPAINYTARDFLTIKEALKVHLQTKFPDTWRDFYESGMGQALLDLIAYSHDVLSFFTDYTANEVFLSTARDRLSILLLGRLVGYQLRTPSSASVVSSTTIDMIYLEDIIIPSGTTLESVNGISFVTVEEARIAAGDLTGSITFVQGVNRSTDVVSDGTVFQKIVLAEPSVIQDTITLTVDGDVWTEVASLTYADANDKSFSVQYDENGIATIQFGDGNSGRVPTNGSVISIAYRTGGGIEGNIALSELSGRVQGSRELVLPISHVTVTVVNDEERGSGGEDAETISHAKLWIPAWVRANGRAVTESDYDALGNAFSDPVYGSPAFTKARLKQEIPELNTVVISCLTGDMKVKLLDGKDESIADLANRSDKTPLWIYAYDKDINKIVPALATNPIKTKEVSKIIEITLDNDEIVRCTEDHQILMRNGSYVEAQHLSEGDSLMPIYVRPAVQKSSKYLHLTHPDGQYQAVHQMVVERLLGGYRSPDKNVCHHKDFNQHNNDPSNLVLMNAHEHRQFHKELARKTMLGLRKDPEFLKKCSEAAREVMNTLWKDPEFRKRRVEFARALGKKSSERYLNDPDFHSYMRPIRQAAGKKLSQAFASKMKNDAEFASSFSALHSRLMKGKRAQFAKDPEYLKKQKEASSKSLIRMWKEDPEFVEKNRLKLAAMNADPDNAKKAQHGKYRTTALKAINLGAITEENWELSRSSKYGVPSFKRMLEVFGCVSNMTEQLEINHRIKSVRVVELDSPAPVYDLSVKQHHNFALSSGIFVHNCWSRDAGGNITTPSLGLKNAIEEYFNDQGSSGVRMICQHAEVEDGAILYIDVDMGIKVATSYVAADAITATQTAIDDLFNSTDVVPGDDFRISALYEAVHSLASVEYCLVNLITASYKLTETIGIGNTVLKTFSGTLTLDSGLEVIPLTVRMFYGDDTEVLTDDGEGTLLDSLSAVAGTVDYETGLISGTFAAAPIAGELVRVEFRYELDYQRGDVEATGDGITQLYEGSVSYPPVNPYDVATGLKGIAFSDGTQVVYDDGSGNLIGDVDVGGQNVIDYGTGGYNFTFANPPALDVDINSTYRQILRTNSEDIPVDKNQISVKGLVAVSTI